MIAINIKFASHFDSDNKEVVCLNRDDIVSILREIANDTSSGGDVPADRLDELADQLEKIER